MKFVDKFPADLKTAKMTQIIATADIRHCGDPPQPWFFLNDMEGYCIETRTDSQDKNIYKCECFTTTRLDYNYPYLIIRGRGLVTMVHNPSFVIDKNGVCLMYYCPHSPWMIEVTFPHKEPK